MHAICVVEKNMQKQKRLHIKNGSAYDQVKLLQIVFMILIDEHFV